MSWLWCLGFSSGKGLFWVQRRRIPLGEEPREETSAKEVGVESEPVVPGLAVGWTNRAMAQTNPESSRATAVTATWDFFLPMRVK